MPYYDYRCPRCKQVQEALRCIALRHEGPMCPDHRKPVPMDLIVSPVRGVVENPAVPRKQK